MELKESHWSHEQYGYQTSPSITGCVVINNHSKHFYLSSLFLFKIADEEPNFVLASYIKIVSYVMHYLYYRGLYYDNKLSFLGALHLRLRQLMFHFPARVNQNSDLNMIGEFV